MSNRRHVIRLILAAAILIAASPAVAEPEPCTNWWQHPLLNYNYVCYSSGTTHPLMHDGWSSYTRWDSRYSPNPNFKRGIETFKFPGYPQENLKADWVVRYRINDNACIWEFTLPLDGIQCRDVLVQWGSIRFRSCNDGHIRDCYY